MNATNILKGFRGKKRISQENLADLLGISRQSYNSLENDILNADFNLVFKTLTILNLTENEITEFFDALKQDYMSYKSIE